MTTPDRIIFILVFSLLFFSAWFIPYDETDDIDNGERSDIKFITDYGTGCQYLKFSYFSEAIPRVNSDGKHICR